MGVKRTILLIDYFAPCCLVSKRGPAPLSLFLPPPLVKEGDRGGGFNTAGGEVEKPTNLDTDGQRSYNALIHCAPPCLAGLEINHYVLRLVLRRA